MADSSRHLIITVREGDWAPEVDITGFTPQEAWAYLQDALSAVIDVIPETKVMSHGELVKAPADEDVETD